MTVGSRLLGALMRLPRPISGRVEVRRDLEIPMRDSTALLADLYTPAGGGPAPTVLTRSPYGRSNWIGTIYGRLFAERGFQVLVQSCRGTFGSGGDFDAFNERDDGLDTIAWIEQQDWYDGRLAMTGASYGGIAQWLVAADSPQLAALSIVNASSDPYDFVYPGGVLSLRSCLSWNASNAADFQGSFLSRLRQGRALDERLEDLYAELPLDSLDDRAVAQSVPAYQAWLRHPERDSFWAQRSATDQAARITVPTCLVAGWYDIFLPYQLADYRSMLDAGCSVQLTIGPWTHGNPAGIGHGLKLSIDWLSGHLLGTAVPERAPVRIFVTGANAWRDLPEWPPPSTAVRWHLHADGGLSPEPADDGQRTFRYDPADPTPYVGGPVLGQDKGPQDNAMLEARADVVVFTSEPLADNYELIGEVSAEVSMSSSTPDFDVFVRLCEVDAKGRSVTVCDGIQAVRGHNEVSPATVGVQLWSIGHRFAKGSRLRVQVSGGSHPRFGRCHGGGEPLATATAVVASDRTLHLGGRASSFVVLPEARSRT
ncbi:MAG TPA: CocE/NonD family hydrolase [Mycobacteriales bacterium]|nr:CocE/NonD family hydrolase [Mycobacteriales bacterium]